MKPFRLLACLALPLVCANHVPPSTERALTARSDLVIVARVAATDVALPRAAPDRVKTDGGIVIGSSVANPCVHVIVERHLKGRAAVSPVVVCASRIAELNPKTLRLGQRYKMFLRRTGGAYVATSWDAITPLPSR